MEVISVPNYQNRGRNEVPMNEKRKKIIAIHQPDYIPWLGFYYKVAHCDQFVYLDDAQYSNEAAHNYNVIKTPQGALRLKIPVQQKLGDLIYQVRTRDELNWKKKHLKTLEMNYKKATYFDQFFPVFQEVIMRDYSNIAELNISINQVILDGFEIKTPCVRTSNMKISSVREDRILEICKKLCASEYLSGNGARVYQKESHFDAMGIVLTYLDYKPIEYKQIWPKVDFLPCMSVIDYIFNCGFNWDFVESEVKKLNEV